MLAHEGRNIVTLLVLAMLVLHLLLGMYVLPLWCFVIAVFFMYRDPNRPTPSAPLGLISPCDGKIISIQNRLDPFLKRESICISIKMNWYGVYVLRSVTEGKIMQHWVHEHSEKHDPEFGQDSQHAIWVQTDEKDDVVISIHAGGRYRSMHCYSATGERVGQGKRCGFIPLGARIDVLLPTGIRVKMQEGDFVKGGLDIIGELVH